MRPFFILLGLGAAAAACRPPHPANLPPPVRTTRDTARVTRQPVPVRDTALEQRAARLELKVLEQAAQVEELQRRLDDARREVVRAMAKLQSLATRAEAASGMAEAEIALQALRSAGGAGSNPQAPTPPEYGQGTQLLQLATTEFDQQNYAGALYLAAEAKNAAAAGQARVATDNRGGGAGGARKGETPFALPLRLQTTGRANVREGPSAGDRRPDRRLLVCGSVGAHQGRRRPVRLDPSNTDRPARGALGRRDFGARGGDDTISPGALRQVQRGIRLRDQLVG